MKRTTLLTAIPLLLAAPIAPAGDLNPPAGPVQSSMIALDRIESRVCINDLPGDASAVHVITEPGLYFLAADVQGQAGKDGIAVRINPALPAGDYPVSIDLAGYDLVGAPGSVDGVRFHSTTPGHKYIDTLFASSGASRITGFDAHGVSTLDAVECTIEGVHVSACGGSGVHALATTATPQRRRIRVDSGVITDASSLTTGPSVVIDSFDDVVCSGLRVADGSGAGVVVIGSEFVSMGDVQVSDCVGPGITVTGTEAINIGSLGLDAVDTRLPPVKVSRCASGITIAAPTARSLDAVLAGVHAHECVGTGVAVDLGGSTGGTLRLSGVLASECAVGVDVSGFGLIATNPAHPTALVDVEMDHVTTSSNLGDGIRVDLDASAQIRTRLDQCLSADNSGAGFRVKDYGGALTEVIECDAFRNADHGAHVEGDVVVTGGVFAHNAGHGIFCCDPDDNCLVTRIAGTSALHNGAAGVHVQRLATTLGSSVHVDSCEFSGNSLAGFRLALGDMNGDGLCDIKSCKAFHNGSHGFAIDDPPTGGTARPTTTSLLECRASSNGGSGFSLHDTECVVRECEATNNGAEGFRLVGESLTLDGFSSEANGAQAVLCDGTQSFDPSGPSVSVQNGKVRRDASLGSACDILSPNDVHISNVSISDPLGPGVLISDATRSVVIRDVTVMSGSSDGIRVHCPSGIPTLSADITQCRTLANAGAGISVLSECVSGRITECSAFSNATVGIECLTLGHIVTNNAAGNNGPGGATNFSVLLPGNALGVIVDETNITTEDKSSVNLTP